MLQRQPPWTNQALVVYHGTVLAHTASVLDGIDLTRCDNDSDFGRGFYTTTNLKQARIFAKISQKLNGGKAAVVSFRVDRDALAALDSLWFVRCTADAEDFWRIIESCRRFGTTNRARDKWYDIAVGPVARSYQVRSAWDGYDQISFHTDKAVGILDNSEKGVI
jgi:hypothetical protein